MASIRRLKKDVDYLVGEVVSNSLTCMYFLPAEKKEEIIAIVEKSVALRNELFNRINNPKEKHNPRLLRKEFRQIQTELMETVDGMFMELSKMYEKK